MKRQIVSFAAAAFFAVGVSTVVWAQPTQDGGGRPAGSGGGTGPGSVSPGGSTSGGGSAASSGGGGSSTSTSSGSVGGGASSMGWDRPGIDFPRASAPMRGPDASAFSDSQGGRSRGGGSSQGRAVPRGTPSGGGSGEGRATPRGESGDRGGGAGRGATTLTMDGGSRDSRGPQRSAVPEYSRPRDGRTVIGTPVDRGAVANRGGSLPWYYNPYYGYYGYPYGSYGYYSRYGWYPGFGFGLGYFYDPFWYDPFGAYGYGGYPYYGGYGGGSGYYRSRGYDTGSLRLKVQPRDAKVYVDGYFVGVVDSFDGVFQKLAVEAGTHRVEIRADGYEPAQFEVMVTPGETITYKGALKRLTQ